MRLPGAKIFTAVTAVAVTWCPYWRKGEVGVHWKKRGTHTLTSLAGGGPWQ